MNAGHNIPSLFYVVRILTCPPDLRLLGPCLAQPSIHRLGNPLAQPSPNHLAKNNKTWVDECLAEPKSESFATRRSRRELLACQSGGSCTEHAYTPHALHQGALAGMHQTCNVLHNKWAIRARTIDGSREDVLVGAAKDNVAHAINSCKPKTWGHLSRNQLPSDPGIVI